MANSKYYVVLNGRKTGIFTNWAECETQVKGFPGALYKSFKTKTEAENALQLSATEFKQTFKQNPKQSEKAIKNIILPDEVIFDSICVDASCLGNPGDVEYQGVDTATGKVLFHKSPMAMGTNNLGEFLAIVHGLRYLQEQGKNIPIYSDSRTAILWVTNKQVKTKLESTLANQEIFNLVEKALNWLKNNQYKNLLLKWNTEAWGEIPADFGRK